METLASQYYAQIGIGSLTRPMVVGDRLWLFSQTPNGQHQTMLVNNMPVPIQKLNNTIRGYPSSAAMPSSTITSPSVMLDSARTNLLNRNQALNYGYPKMSQYLPRPASHLKPYDTFMAGKYLSPNDNSSKFLPPNNNNNNNAYEKNDPNLIGYLENIKYTPTGGLYYSTVENTGVEDAIPSSGIRELERVFGGSERCSQLFEIKSERLSGLTERENDNECTSEGSDIDCEHLDDT